MNQKMSREDLQTFLGEHFPQVADDFDVVEAGAIDTVIEMNIADNHLRPGGTVSGPTMFSLADVAMYLALLARIGPEALAVTTNCSINFMRKPVSGVNLVAKARVLKLGKALAVGDVFIYSKGKEDPVAQAHLTYSIPPVSK